MATDKKRRMHQSLRREYCVRLLSMRLPRTRITAAGELPTPPDASMMTTLVPYFRHVEPKVLQTYVCNLGCSFSVSLAKVVEVLRGAIFSDRIITEKSWERGKKTKAVVVDEPLVSVYDARSHSQARPATGGVRVVYRINRNQTTRFDDLVFPNDFSTLANQLSSGTMTTSFTTMRPPLIVPVRPETRYHSEIPLVSVVTFNTLERRSGGSGDRAGSVPLLICEYSHVFIRTPIFSMIVENPTDYARIHTRIGPGSRLSQS